LRQASRDPRDLVSDLRRAASDPEPADGGPQIQPLALAGIAGPVRGDAQK